MRRFVFSLRFFMAALIFIVLIPCLHLLYYNTQQLYGVKLQEAQNSTTHFAEHLSLEITRALDTVNIVWALLRDALTHDEQQAAFAMKTASDLHKLSPMIKAISLIDVHGKVMASTVPGAVGQDVSDRPFFQYVLEHRAPFVGEWQRGKYTSAPSLPFAVPLRADDSGEIKGVAYCAIDASWCASLLSDLEKTQQTVVGILDSSGKILFRYPDPERLSGGGQLEDVNKHMLAAGEGSFIRKGIDGVVRQYSFVSLPTQYGTLHPYAGIPIDVIVAEPDRLWRQNLLTAGAIGLLVLGIGFIVQQVFVQRGVDALVAHARQIAAGDLSARTQNLPPVRELREIGQSLDKMTEALHRNHAEIHEALAKNKMLLDASPLGIVTVEEGRITYANPAAIDMFAAGSATEMIGKSPLAFISPEFHEQLLRGQEQRLKGESAPFSYEVKALKSTGELFDAVLWPKAVEAFGGPSLLVFMADVSETKRLQEQLIQSQKMEAIGTLAGGIAHDFNNILFAVTGFTELALDNLTEGHPARGYLTRVLDAARRAGDMTRQILTFSRKTGPEEAQPLSLQPIVKEALKFIRGSIPSTIEITQHIEPDLDKILGNVSQIHQVLMNLFTNAAYAMGKGKGTLHVELSEVEVDPAFASLHPPMSPGRHIKLTVADTGPGIPPEIMNRIFEPYFTTKPVGEGTGLGLAVVHGIVSRHGGAITVESAPGKGTSFHVYFPVVEAPEAQQAAPEQVVLTGSGSVLVVDDEQWLREMLSAMLTGMGYTVSASENGAKALEMVRSNPSQFDVILTDLTMPKMTGTELAREIKAIRSDLPVILCTGALENSFRKEGDEDYIRAVLKKPVTKAELSRVLAEVLAEQTERKG